MLDLGKTSMLRDRKQKKPPIRMRECIKGKIYLLRMAYLYTPFLVNTFIYIEDKLYVHKFQFKFKISKN